MNLKTKVLLLLVAFACAAPCGAQEEKKKPDARPDFSGTWAREAKESNTGKERPTLVISHREPEVRIRHTPAPDDGEAGEAVYYSDGRGESNHGPWYTEEGAKRRDEIKSKTTWKGTTLVTRAEIKRLVRGAAEYLIITDKWTLSKDGKSLTLIRTLWTRNARYLAMRSGGQATMTDSGPGEYKSVFRRVPDQSEGHP
jgi:hypothetical protein